MAFGSSAKTTTPPGPRGFGFALGLGWLLAESRLFPRWRERYGDVFMLHKTGFGVPLVVLSNPADAKRVFGSDASTVRAGEANSAPLRQLVGEESLLLLDDERHIDRRKLMLPPFHGERMRAYGELMSEIADAEIDRWLLNQAFPLRPSMQAITLRIILRAVFGIEHNERALASLEKLFVRYANEGLRPWMLLMAQRELPCFGPWRPFLRTRAEVDEFLGDEIERRSNDPNLAERNDILSLLLGARDEEGTGLSPTELRDQLMTLLIAGHETTATALAWSIERLLRHPEVMRRLRAELAEGRDEYLGCVVKESLRSRPVIPFVLRVATEPVAVGAYMTPANSLIAISINLLHHRQDLYPEPGAFRPERFEDGQTESFAWLPFGGGVRRCIGATFATYEMEVVLRRILERCELRAPDLEPERPKRRGIVSVPHRGTRVVISRRRPASETSVSSELTLAAF